MTHGFARFWPFGPADWSFGQPVQVKDQLRLCRITPRCPTRGTADILPFQRFAVNGCTASKRSLSMTYYILGAKSYAGISHFTRQTPDCRNPGETRRQTQKFGSTSLSPLNTPGLGHFAPLCVDSAPESESGTKRTPGRSWGGDGKTRPLGAS